MAYGSWHMLLQDWAFEPTNKTTKKNRKIKSNRILLCVFVRGAPHVFCIRRYLCTGPLMSDPIAIWYSDTAHIYTPHTHTFVSNQSDRMLGALGILWKHFRPQSNFIFATLNGLAIDFHVDFKYLLLLLHFFVASLVAVLYSRLWGRNMWRSFCGWTQKWVVLVSSIQSIHIQYNCIHKLTASNHNMNGRLIDAFTLIVSHWTFTW